MVLSVIGFESNKTVYIRIYDVTTSTEVVSWTSTGVQERPNGEGYSVYYYDYSMTSGHEYIIDWKDNSTPTNTASEMISYNLDATVSSRASQASVDNIPTNPLLDNDLRLDYLDANISSRSTFDHTTDKVTVQTNEDKTGYSLTSAYDPAKTTAQETTTQSIKAQTDKLSFIGSDVKATLDGEKVTVQTNEDKTGYSLTSTSEDSIVSKVWSATERTLTSFGTLVQDIWNYTNRTLTSFGSLVSDIWSHAERTLTSFGTLVQNIWSYTTRKLTSAWTDETPSRDMASQIIMYSSISVLVMEDESIVQSNMPLGLSIAKVNSDKSIDLLGKQGATWSLVLNVLDEDGNPMDLTDWSVRGQLRKSYKAGDKYSFDCEIINAESGVIRIGMSAENTSLIPTIDNKNPKHSGNTYVYDIEIENAIGVVLRVMEGSIYIDPEVTK